MKEKYDYFHYVKYASQIKGTVEKYIKTFKNQAIDYIFVGDLDAKGFDICVTTRKQKIQKEHGEIVENNKIVIVKEEIESWYLAVCNEENQQKYKLTIPANTEKLTKEVFEKMIPKNNSRIDFMVEILKTYSIDFGKQRNQSFNFFFQKVAN